MRSVCLHADVDGLLLNAYNTSVADDRPSVRVLLGAVLRDNFLIDGESRNICWEFLADLLADMLPGIAAESKGFPVVSLEQMDLNSRYPPAGSLFNNVRGRPGICFFLRAGACRAAFVLLYFYAPLSAVCPREILRSASNYQISSQWCSLSLRTTNTSTAELSLGDKNRSGPNLFGFSGRATCAGHQST